MDQHPTDVDGALALMKAKLGTLVPEFELEAKAELVAEIERLKLERNAIILGHNYMEPALFHTVPDYVGDSLELSRIASEAEQDVIVFCGVRFMAETANILNPDKTTLLPARIAGCSLAASITAQDVRDLRAQFPGVPVVTYINTYADVKAECDICCTSGNAHEVVESLGAQQVIFLPDEFLAKNVARETNKEIIVPTRQPKVDPDVNYQMIGWHGRCEVHERFTVQDIQAAREQVPDVVVLAHPECPPDVVEASDFSASTTAMVRFVQNSKAKHFLILTECSMADNIVAENPDKEMVRMCSIRCPHMNEISLKETRDALRDMRYVIEVPEPARTQARRAVQAMLDVLPKRQVRALADAG